jgi:hypothetical protein
LKRESTAARMVSTGFGFGFGFGLEALSARTR